MQGEIRETITAYKYEVQGAINIILYSTNNRIKNVYLPNNDKLREGDMLFAQRIKLAREEKGLLQKQLASALRIDVPMYSKIERGKRNAKREQVDILAEVLNTDKDELIALWLADKIHGILAHEYNAIEALRIAQKTL